MSVRRTTSHVPALESTFPFAALRGTLRYHGIGILIALLLAATLIFPRWWMIASEPDAGVRVPLSPYGAGAIGYDEALYTSTIRQAYDGQIPVSDPYVLGHQDDVPQRSALPHAMIGALGKLTGGPFTAMALVTTLAAVSALLLMYALLYQITGSRWAAVGLIPVLLVAIHVLNQAQGFLPLRHADVLSPIIKADPLRQVHAWTRFPAPILVLAPFFGAVIALPRAVESGRRGWMTTAVVMLALLVYTYVFYWTAFALAAALWLAFLVLQGERQQALRLVAIGGFAFLLAIPEIIVLVSSLTSLPDDARERVGLNPFGIEKSVAAIVAQRAAIGLPFLVLLARGPSRNFLYGALFTSPLILVSLSGVVPQEWHYHTQVWGVFAIPAFVAGAVGMASSPRAKQIAQPAGIALAVAAAVCFAYVVTLQLRAVRMTDAAFALTTDEDGAISWIRANVEDNETVVSPSITTNLLLASLSPAAQYIAEGGFSTADDEELTDRILRAQAGFGYTEDEAFSRLDVHGPFAGFPTNDASGTTEELEEELEGYLAFFTFSFEISDQDAFRDRMEVLRPRYRELLNTRGVLAAYNATYLYCGHRERFYAVGRAAPETFVRVAHRSGGVAIYEIVDEEAPEASEFAGCASAP